MCAFYLLEQADEQKLEKFLIEPLIKYNGKQKKLDKLLKGCICIADAEKINTFEDVNFNIMKGDAILLADGTKSAMRFGISKQEHRAIIEPPTSAVIFGPREGFIESIKVNTNLIRKRLPTTSLKLIELNLGRYTKTKVEIVYLNDIADKTVVEKIIERLKKIDIDGIIDSHYLTSYLEERPGSIFKQIGKTEKPDILVAKMLEGRVGILVDGSPIALTLPFVLIEELQNSDDYYQRSFRISIVRIFRLVGVLFSILLPGVYVAIQLYHYRIIPIKFLVTITNSTQTIPFTPFLEMLFVIVLFEILFEASLRMPKYLGVALSIVGALVLGDTAVKAGLVSSPAVMIIALTGISFYTVPDETSQLGVLRLLFTMLGGTIGLLGIIIGGMILVCYLGDFNAYKSPYLAPYAPFIKQDLKDGIFKRRTNVERTRPRSIPNQKIVKQKMK